MGIYVCFANTLSPIHTVVLRKLSLWVVVVFERLPWFVVRELYFLLSCEKWANWDVASHHSNTVWGILKTLCTIPTILPLTIFQSHFRHQPGPFTILISPTVTSTYVFPRSLFFSSISPLPQTFLLIISLTIIIALLLDPGGMVYLPSIYFLSGQTPWQEEYTIVIQTPFAPLITTTSYVENSEYNFTIRATCSWSTNNGPSIEQGGT